MLLTTALLQYISYNVTILQYIAPTICSCFCTGLLKYITPTIQCYLLYRTPTIHHFVQYMCCSRLTSSWTIPCLCARSFLTAVNTSHLQYWVFWVCNNWRPWCGTFGVLRRPGNWGWTINSFVMKSLIHHFLQNSKFKIQNPKSYWNWKSKIVVIFLQEPQLFES